MFLDIVHKEKFFDQNLQELIFFLTSTLKFIRCFVNTRLNELLKIFLIVVKIRQINTKNVKLREFFDQKLQKSLIRNSFFPETSKKKFQNYFPPPCLSTDNIPSHNYK